jgi:hypothetical protein
MSAAGRSRVISGDLVGRDFARVRLSATGTRARPLRVLLVTAFACAFAIAALRIDILRVRYALGEAVSEEKALVLELRSRSAELESLRDPSRLAELAREQGFRRPDRLLVVAPQAADSPAQPVTAERRRR